MENFIFYYTLFRNFDFAMQKMQEDSTYAKHFLNTALELCKLESQTFLTDDSKALLQTYNESLLTQINQFRDIDLTLDEWRIRAGLMCTFMEWCQETKFFELDLEKQKYIFPENPVDGYFSVIDTKVL